MPQRCYSLHQYGLGTGEAPVELRNNLVPSSICIVQGDPEFLKDPSKHRIYLSEVHGITAFAPDVVRVISVGQARFNEQNRHGQQIQEDRADGGTTGGDSTSKQEAENETSIKPNTRKSIPPFVWRDAEDLVVRSDVYRQKQIRLPFSQGSTSSSIVHQTPDPHSETPTFWHLRPLREMFPVRSRTWESSLFTFPTMQRHRPLGRHRCRPRRRTKGERLNVHAWKSELSYDAFVRRCGFLYCSIAPASRHPHPFAFRLLIRADQTCLQRTYVQAVLRSPRNSRDSAVTPDRQQSH